MIWRKSKFFIFPHCVCTTISCFTHIVRKFATFSPAIFCKNSVKSTFSLKSYTVNQFDEKILQWGKISEIFTLWHTICFLIPLFSPFNLIFYNFHQMCSSSKEYWGCVGKEFASKLSHLSHLAVYLVINMWTLAFSHFDIFNGK